MSVIVVTWEKDSGKDRPKDVPETTTKVEKCTRCGERRVYWVGDVWVDLWKNHFDYCEDVEND